MNSPVQKIKERLSVEEVISSYIKLDGAGANLKARCPFHNEKTASFFVSPGRGSYYCFGCGASGDIFTFVEEFEGVDFKGALKTLASRAGVELERYNKEEESEKEKLYRVMEDATEYFFENLEKKNAVLEYLKSRGVNDKSLQDFRIGFADPEWRLLHAYLSRKGWKEEIMEKAGLIKKTDKGFYDRFRGRIMFPIMDSSGRVAAFSGRIFVDDGKSAKYLNSPETPIFHKNAVLYGIDKAKDSIRRNNFSILVEGQMDLILSHQAGYKNTVATSGTALSDQEVSKENVVSNLGLVRRLSPNIVLGFDGDKAGAGATVRAGKIALSLGMDVKVASLPEGSDPADFILKEGGDKWREAIKDSKHLIEFLLLRVLDESKDDMRKAGRDIKDKVLPFVNSIESSIERMHFIKKISERADIPVAALEEDLGKIECEGRREHEEIIVAKENLKTMYRRDYIKRKLLGMILWQKTAATAIIDTEEALKRLASIGEETPALLLEEASLNKEDLIFEAEVFYGKPSGEGGFDLNKEIDELFSNLEEESLKDKLGQKMRELSKAEESKDKDASSQILRECQLLNQRIQEIKNGRINKKL